MSAIGGCASDEFCNQHEIDAYFQILQSIKTGEEAMNAEIAKKNLAETVEWVFSLFSI